MQKVAIVAVERLQSIFVAADHFFTSNGNFKKKMCNGHVEFKVHFHANFLLVVKKFLNFPAKKFSLILALGNGCDF